MARPGLPLKVLDAAARLAPSDTAAAASLLPRLQLPCSPGLQLSVVQLAEHAASLADQQLLCQQHLGTRLASAALLPPASLNCSALLGAPPVPAGLLQRLRATPPAAAARREGQQYGQQLLESALEAHRLPPSSGEAASAAVLIYVGAAAHTESTAASAASKGSIGSSSSKQPAPAATVVTAVQVQEDALAVFVTVPAAGVPPAGAALGEVAAAVQGWLESSLQRAAAAAARQAGSGSGGADGGSDSSSGGAAQAGELAAACAAGAGALLAQFLAALSALPKLPVSQELSLLAGKAAAAVLDWDRQQQRATSGGNPGSQEALQRVREAWGAAWAVAHHPGFGTDPIFPWDHQLAIVLPLSLPLCLVMVRAVGRELKEWRRSRQAGKAAGAAAAAAAEAKKED